MKRAVLVYKIRTLNEKFKRYFHVSASDVFTSPGRIELIGNHTDHNNGMVLVSSIDMMIIAISKKSDDNFIIYHTEGFYDMKIDINDLNKKESELSSSLGMIRGILFKMKELGYKIGGAYISTTSNIFKGAGVSSSAAFELLICQIMNHYYNDDKIDPYTLAKIAQYSEQEYFGKPCGLLDQTGIALGGINFIDFKNPENPIIKNINVKLTKYDITLVNTKDSHSKLTSLYTKIKDDMFKIASFFEKNVLREVNEEDFYNKEEKLIEQFGKNVYLRGKHYFEENRRVLEAFEAISSGKELEFVNLLKESGVSSFHQLKNCYVKSKKENLPKAILISTRINKDGCVRVHGGGFAGTILVFTKKKRTKNYREAMSKIFGKANVKGVSFNQYGTRYVGRIDEVLNKNE